jgi:spore coat protein E
MLSHWAFILHTHSVDRMYEGGYSMSEYEQDFQCREIISRAVCGNGKKFTQVIHRIQTPHQPSTILGAWVINHQYEAVRYNEGIEVEGGYDINIWYSCDGNTKTDVAKESLKYVEHVPLTFLDEKHLQQTAKVYAQALQQPSCVEATVHPHEGIVQVTVEFELQVEMLAETKLCVVVCPGGCDRDHKDDLFEDADELSDFDDDLFMDEES